jgi:adenylate cyclase
MAAALRVREIRPFLFDQLFPAAMRLPVDEAAARAGVDAGRVRQLRAALGFTGDTILESDLQALGSFQALEAAGLPWEAVIEAARVFGDALRRIAETEVRLVHVHIHERLMASGLSDEQITQQIGDLQDAALPLLDGLVGFIHHEHLLQASIEDIYLHLPGAELPAERGSVQTAIVFLDLDSFTELTQARGDAIALDTLTRLDGAVRPLVLEHEGKLVKQLGDGLMLAFHRPDDAVEFAAAAVAAVADDPAVPPLHVGIHAGPAIQRAGDYVGDTVNLASRVSSGSTAGEILMTEAVASALGEAQLVEPVGVRMLRGAARPQKLYRLIRSRQHIDPICGAPVRDPPAAQLRHDDDELWFCSQVCLREFLEQPDRRRAVSPPS